MQPSPTLATILLAAATGARSTIGVAATARSVAAIEPNVPAPQPARFLAKPGVAAGAAERAVMELVADKLPGSRTGPTGSGAR